MLGKFALRGSRGGSVAVVLAGSGSITGQVAGLSGLAASITGNQALSGALGAPVAHGPSHTGRGSAEIRQKCLPCALMASLWTLARSLAASWGARAARIDRGGVSPLSPPPSATYAGRAGQTSNLAKSGANDAATIAANRASPFQGQKSGAKQGQSTVGFGVRGQLPRSYAELFAQVAAKSVKIRVRGRGGAHSGLRLSRAMMLRRERG